MAIFIPFTLKLTIWNKGVLSWSFWCFFSEAIIIGVGLFSTMAVIKWYKKKIQDVLPNEQTFAERYYYSLLTVAN